jgi:putative PIN family toxin of toxin-antitoxin system
MDNRKGVRARVSRTQIRLDLQYRMQYHESVAAAYVLDTDVIVAAFRSSRGASRQLLLAGLEHQFELLLSVPLMLEYEAVLTRPQHLSASGLSSAEVGRVLDDLASVARPVRLAFRWRPILADPDDDMVLETAINGSASAIITFNQRDFAAGAKSFRCAVIPPATALQQIRSRTHETE